MRSLRGADRALLPRMEHLEHHSMTPLFLGLAVSLSAPAPKETPKEPPKLEGDWVVQSIEGEKGPPETVTMRFKDGKVSILAGKREEPGANITVDFKMKPATIDIRPDNAPAEVVVRGIIEINGDTMKLCFTKQGERPNEFKGDAANRIALITLKRVKPEK
jgi:uncharacterized protein (TIGR03067 family)